VFWTILMEQLLFAALCTAVSVYAYLGRRHQRQPALEAEGADPLQDPLLPAAGAGTASGSSSSGIDGQDLPLQRVLCIVVLVALAGMVAGVVGIGGGLLMGPMLLDMGVHPQVSKGACHQDALSAMFVARRLQPAAAVCMTMRVCTVS
jgi:uncharacterized membrane protein YfcA